MESLPEDERQEIVKKTFSSVETLKLNYIEYGFDFSALHSFSPSRRIIHKVGYVDFIRDGTMDCVLRFGHFHTSGHARNDGGQRFRMHGHPHIVVYVDPDHEYLLVVPITHASFDESKGPKSGVFLKSKFGGGSKDYEYVRYGNVYAVPNDARVFMFANEYMDFFDEHKDRKEWSDELLKVTPKGIKHILDLSRNAQFYRKKLAELLHKKWNIEAVWTWDLSVLMDGVQLPSL